MNWVKAFYLIGIPCFLLHACATDAVQTADDGPSEEEPPKKPKMEFGLIVDSLEHSTHSIRFGETFSGILDAAGVDRQTQFRIQTMGSDVFDPARIQEGKTIHFYRSVQDSAQEVRHMVYAESALTYVRIDLKDSLLVQRIQKEVQVRERILSTSIRSSLYEDLLKDGGSVDLALKVADLYAWSIDFFRLQKGDALVVAYDERFVDDSVRVGLGNIRHARFRHADKNFDAYRMESDGRLIDYYDEDGRSLRKAFLKSPLDFFRISSRFNRRRFHPVLKRVKPHLGTDYAAPKGTPIRTTADGVISKTGYTRGNGNYVKVRHNGTYSTQYLHMSKIKKGIKQGVAVTQGDVIGYVGSTGLATGPHVCYRFWKNGQQVDPLKEKLPEAKTIEKVYEEPLRLLCDSIRPQLDQLMEEELARLP
jgi:murein DD-endopeptidase MepM/ murein hydrolase activator NlpD